MRIRTEAYQSTTEVTLYGCDRCNYESDSEEDLKKHIGQCHAIEQKLKVGDDEWLFFRREEDYKIYLDSFDGFMGADIREGMWSGPGWYSTLCELENCRRGCCTDYRTRLYHVDYFIQLENRKVTEAEKQIQKAHARTIELCEVRATDPWAIDHPADHKFSQDEPPIPGRCTYTWPDGEQCERTAVEHTPPKAQ